MLDAIAFVCPGNCSEVNATEFAAACVFRYAVSTVARCWLDHTYAALPSLLCVEKVDEVARKYFPGVDEALERPLLYSSWLSKVPRRRGTAENNIHCSRSI